MTVVSSISESSFRRLHPDTIEDEAEIRSLLRRASAMKTVLRRSTNRWIEAEEGTISRITPESFCSRPETSSFETSSTSF